MLRQLSGLNIMEIYSGDKTEEYFSEKYSRYIEHWHKGLTASSKFPIDSDERELYNWLLAEIGAEIGSEYVFIIPLNDRVNAAKIKINDVFDAINSLWNHRKFFGEKYYSRGFILIDTVNNKLIDAGSDSGDELNYQIYIWNY